MFSIYFTAINNERSQWICKHGKNWLSLCDTILLFIKSQCNNSGKVKTVPSTGKVTATVFWDARGMIFNDYFQKGKTINSEYYANLLQRLSDDIKKKRSHLVKKEVLFLQDNATSKLYVFA